MNDEERARDMHSKQMGPVSVSAGFYAIFQITNGECLFQDADEDQDSQQATRRGNFGGGFFVLLPDVIAKECLAYSEVED